MHGIKFKWVLLVLGIFAASPVRAADTVETFDPGFSDFEFYGGIDALGLPHDEKGVFGDMLVGVGLANRFSGYLGVTMEADDYLTNGAVSLATGIFGTVVETPHFDMDMFLDVSVMHTEFTVTPSLEFNLDSKDDMSGFGFYLRAGVPMYGEAVTDPANSDTVSERSFYADIALNPGVYLTLAEIHQLLLEFDTTLVPMHDGEQAKIGGGALGYNVMITDAIELVNQAYFDLPQEGEKFSFGWMTGIIATLGD